MFFVSLLKNIFVSSSEKLKTISGKSIHDRVKGLRMLIVNEIGFETDGSGTFIT